jgi:MFS family permease
VYLIAFGLGLVTAVDNPTRQAFVAEMVGPDHLGNAVGLNSASFNLARIGGPAVAGVLINVIGTGPLFLFNACTYLAVIMCLLMLREKELHRISRSVRAAAGSGIRDGLKYVRERPELLLPIVIVGFVGMFGLNFQITNALFATRVFHMGASSYGLLSSAVAVGSLGGALLAATRQRPTRRLLVGSALAFGVLELAAAVMPSYWAFVVMLVPIGLASLTMATAANTIVQLAVSPAMRGRVMALYLLVFMGGTPFGAPLIGWIADQLGARYSLIVGGGVSTLAVVVAALVVARMGGRTIRHSLREVGAMWPAHGLGRRSPWPARRHRRRAAAGRPKVEPAASERTS